MIESQLQNHRLQVAIQEARYRTGQGSTRNMLLLWQRTETLEARCVERLIGQAQDRRELEIWTGYETDYDTGLDIARIDDCSAGAFTTVPRAGWSSPGEARAEE